jgi:pimeloyl-ACP methyl ester carboxylesterase
MNTEVLKIRETRQIRGIRVPNGMTFPYLNETEDLTDAVRASAGGSFICLSDGVCHYELKEVRNTQLATRTTIVLIHGFSVPYFIWEPTFDFLTNPEPQFLPETGVLRVLRYDLFGRGDSDRPRVRYGIDLYVRQLRDLLDALEIREPVCLAGLSMGGPVAATFTAQFPGRVEKLILIDPAGAKPVQFVAAVQLVKIPLLPELFFGFASDEFLLRSIAADFFDPALIEAFIERYRPQMKFKGFKRALLSTVRNGMLGDFSETYRRVGALKKPTLLFWGREDSTVPFAHSDNVRAAIPQAEFHVIEGAGHIPHYEKPGEVNPILLQFLAGANWQFALHGDAVK